MAKFLRALVVVPAFLAGVWTFHRVGAESRAAEAVTLVPAAELKVGPLPAHEQNRNAEVVERKQRAVQVEASAARKARSEPTRASSSDRTSPEAIIEKRIRIERLLVSLDSIAAVALQMQPEHSSRLEPVIVDLAERTLELVDADVLATARADDELEEIESTVDGLMETMTRWVETETTL